MRSRRKSLAERWNQRLASGEAICLESAGVVNRAHILGVDNGPRSW